MTPHHLGKYLAKYLPNNLVKYLVHVKERHRQQFGLLSIVGPVIAGERLIIVFRWGHAKSESYHLANVNIETGVALNNK